MEDSLGSDLARIEAEIRALPSVLYKYVSLDGECLERVAANIENSTLFFSTREKLNDPFEFGVYPSFDATEAQIRAWVAEQIALDPDGDQSVARRREAEMIAGASDPAQHALEVVKFRAMQDETLAVLCLSEANDNLGMWAYYADGHKGACLILDTSLQTLVDFPKKPCPYPLKVEYEDDMPSFFFYTADHEEYTKLSMATKASVWEHEREWRLVYPEGRFLESVPRNMISGLIFGARTPEPARERLLDACRAAQGEMAAYEAVCDDRHYRLDIRLVEP